MQAPGYQAHISTGKLIPIMAHKTSIEMILSMIHKRKAYIHIYVRVLIKNHTTHGIPIAMWPDSDLLCLLNLFKSGSN